MLTTNQQTELIKNYLEKNKDKKSREVARELFTKHKKDFKSIEQVRSRVRYFRGQQGPQSKRNIGQYIENVNAKILIFDIETAPIQAFVWGLWDQNVGIPMIQNDWFVFTWSAKWLFEDKVYSAKLTSQEAKNKDDKRIIKGIWGMLNEADIVITHNGDKFDIRKLNTRFMIHELHPPAPFQSIDTLKHLRRHGASSSNKLDYINKQLGLTRKMDTGGFELWEKCYKGDTKALAKMEEYNIQDVKILEETYLRIRSWIRPHPNIGLFLEEGEDNCPSCGGTDLKIEGTYNTQASVYSTFRCNNCGSVGRKRGAVKKKKNLTFSVK